MSDPGGFLLELGAIFLAGLAVNALGRLTRLPRVTLLLLLGFAIGPAGLRFLSLEDAGPLSFVSEVALLMIGFLLGEKLSAERLRRHGRSVLCYSLAVSLGTAVIVAVGLPLTGAPLALALLLGAIATATDPAATVDVVRETGAKGPFTAVLLGTVALDDAWGLILFSLVFVAAQTLAGPLATPDVLVAAVREIGGSFLLGVGLGVPVALLSGRIRPGEPTLLEALGAVFLCGGLAKHFDLAPLFATLVLGATVANLARHHDRPFHAIEEIEGPFLIVLFIFAGASLDLESLGGLGWLGAAYVGLRILGRVLGSRLGGRLARDDPRFRGWMGAALLPQAGVALGMGLLVANRLPEVGAILLPVVVGSTVAFEIVGPIVTRIALGRVGEAGADRNVG